MHKLNDPQHTKKHANKSSKSINAVTQHAKNPPSRITHNINSMTLITIHAALAT